MQKAKAEQGKGTSKGKRKAQDSPVPAAKRPCAQVRCFVSCLHRHKKAGQAETPEACKMPAAISACHASTMLQSRMCSSG